MRYIPFRFGARIKRSSTLQLLVLSICLLFLQGCAATKSALSNLPFAAQPPEILETNEFTADDQDEVIGRLATMKLRQGDTLPDIARHFSLGINTVSAANPVVDVWVPRSGDRIVLPLQFILPEATREGLVINLAAMRLFAFQKDGDLRTVATYPVGVGTAERQTPLGKMRITRKKFRPTWYVPASIAEDHRRKGDPLPAQVPPGPENPLGEHALYLSRPGYLIHGTNKPASIGLRATNGCIRLYPEDIERLFASTTPKTPVRIIHQPYLIGRRDGVVYLEAHPPFEELGGEDLKQTLAKLKSLENEHGYRLDWERVDEVVAEARGIPLAISAVADKRTDSAPVRVKHPLKLYGQPQAGESRTDAWYVLAAVYDDTSDARRLAAIIRHQGPSIPALVLSDGDRHRVLAGPFDNDEAALEAARRMRIYLEIDGVLVAPVE